MGFYFALNAFEKKDLVGLPFNGKYYDYNDVDKAGDPQQVLFSVKNNRRMAFLFSEVVGENTEESVDYWVLSHAQLKRVIVLIEDLSDVDFNYVDRMDVLNLLYEIDTKFDFEKQVLTFDFC